MKAEIKSMVTSAVTHWLQSPNKNYLGHWDLPNGRDIIVTIKTVRFEEVKNPKLRTSEEKKVIRFKENFKPFICNEINSQMISKITNQNNPQKCIGMKIQLGVGQTKIMGENVDCLRVRNIKSSELEANSKTISQEQFNILNKLLDEAGKDKAGFCKSLNIDSVNHLPIHKYDKVVNQLRTIISKK